MKAQTKKGSVKSVGARSKKSAVARPSGESVLLIVEPDATFRRRLKQMLLKTSADIDIVEAGTVATAIRRFEDHRPGTILLALALPDGSGLEVLRHAMASDDSCMVIVLAEQATSEMRLQCFEEGADFVFTKSDATDRAVITAQKASQRELARSSRKPVPQRIQRATLTLSNKTGLHVLPAARLLRATQRFLAKIEIAGNGKVADGKNLMEILALRAEMGTVISVTAEGDDAVQAIMAIRSLVARKFHEGPAEKPAK